MSDTKKLTYKSPKDQADLFKIQDSAIKSVTRARENVQVALVATLIHIAKHGDYTGANRLVAGVGNAVNGAALVEFFVRFGGLVVSPEGKEFSGWTNAKYIVDALNDAKATMWWSLKKVNPFAGYNAEAEAQKFLAKFNSMAKKAGEGQDADKINLVIQDQTMKAILALAKFEAIELEEAA